MQLISHRGFWWPRRELQNHPASVLAAFAAGFGVEVDVWGIHGGTLQVGHDGPQHELTLPFLAKKTKLVLHLKTSKNVEAICAVLQERGWGANTDVFFSPECNASIHKFPADAAGPRRLATIGHQDALVSLLQQMYLLSSIEGIWLEQPDEDWVDESTIEMIHAAGRVAYVVSPELHGRIVDLASLRKWEGADGIVTDYPHLFSQIISRTESDGIVGVHPQDPWWL